ncbi:MAG: hypothetical protein U5O16_21305 [Rhodococcus sp. (in: high G+C Gram-positive bacteria)]|uniref:hypothetical protein n=1 Tax=Rhodococcus sp. TaxID=1831 RepID=UPI002ADA7483|nr:hypothetical protein [Rhodococcus sp. (in: high G+C Gram-positive bacteria)]
MDANRSSLRRALRRVGGRLDDVTDVDGTFNAVKRRPSGDRVYGTLTAIDASIAVGFDAKYVPLPSCDNCRMTISGRVWLDDRTGMLTIMVRNYRVLQEK